jgi:hypothetical protein
MFAAITNDYLQVIDASTTFGNHFIVGLLWYPYSIDMIMASLYT